MGMAGDHVTCACLISERERRNETGLEGSAGWTGPRKEERKRKELREGGSWARAQRVKEEGEGKNGTLGLGQG